jgi:hypothetical protein
MTDNKSGINQSIIKYERLEARSNGMWTGEPAEYRWNWNFDCGRKTDCVGGNFCIPLFCLFVCYFFFFFAFSIYLIFWFLSFVLSTFSSLMELYGSLWGQGPPTGKCEAGCKSIYYRNPIKYYVRHSIERRHIKVHRFSVATPARRHQSECVFRFLVYGGIFDGPPGL